MAAAIFDALFGLGRLQPLVDDPDVENIEITGDAVRMALVSTSTRPVDERLLAQFVDCLTDHVIAVRCRPHAVTA